MTTLVVGFKVNDREAFKEMSNQFFERMREFGETSFKDYDVYAISVEDVFKDSEILDQLKIDGVVTSGDIGDAIEQLGYED